MRNLLLNKKDKLNEKCNEIDNYGSSKGKV
jgi:hypothetical protein